MICSKTAEQVCHDFDQFLPLNAVVKGYFNSKAAYKFIAYFLPYITMSNR